MKLSFVSNLWNRIYRQIRLSSPFAEGSAAWFILGGIVLMTVPKAAIHLWINQYHSPVFDALFKTITIFGDGITAVLLVVFLLFVRFRFALMMAVSNIACSVIVQSLKHTLFEGSVRPHEFFKNIHPLYFVPGVDMYSFNSFPSGHSATIFTTCTLLCFMVRKQSLRCVLLFAAFLVAFSRVYLSQHFLGDIYAGSLIGVFAAYVIASFWNVPDDSNQAWLNQSLRTVLRRRG